MTTFTKPLNVEMKKKLKLRMRGNSIDKTPIENPTTESKNSDIDNAMEAPPTTQPT